jgi:hypothetical protein
VYDTVRTLNTLAGSQRNWSLDAVGSWSSSQSDGTATNRTHNRQNELISRTNTFHWKRERSDP